MKKTIRRNPNLRYSKPQLLRLEPRIMFDGAAVDTTVEVAGGHDGGSMDPAMEQIQQAMEQSFGPQATEAPQDQNAPNTATDPQAGTDTPEQDHNAQPALAGTDGADADTNDTHLLELTESAEPHQELLSDAASLANDKLIEWLNSDNFRDQAAEIFSADAGSAEWNAQLDALRTDILSGNYSIRTEVRSNAEMQGLLGVFSATGTSGEPTIYLNADYLATANATQLSQVLIEEIGHAIDNQLNSGKDSLGDEGHAFAALLITGNADLDANQIRDDHHSLVLDGQAVSVEAAGPYNIAQTHFVPMPEDQIWSGIQNIYSSSSDNKIESIIAITATSKDTYIVYDHWEDGYEADIKNPAAASTRIWYYNASGQWVDVKTGTTLTEGQTVNGVTAMGQSLILRNQVVKSTLQSVVDFDGRDKIGSTKAISVTRAGWDTKIGTIVGGAVNLIDTGNAGKEFVIPVGSDTAEAPKISGTSILQKNSLYIMAYEDNTQVTVTLTTGQTITRTLQQGESLYIKGLATGGTFKAGSGLNDAEAVINDGTKVTATKAIGVNMLSGSNTSQNRWYGIAATEAWGNSYYAPVATVGGATSHIYLYNNNDSAITVNYETRNPDGSIKNDSVSVAANSAKVVAMPASAGHFYSSNGEKFYAVATVDPTTSRDWSYSLVAERTLTDRFVVAWGPGNGNNAGANGVISGKNGNPVWVTAVDDTYLYIDSGTTELKDAQGNTIAKDAAKSTAEMTAYKIDRLQSYRLRDTSDNNQTGLVVYTKDGTLITAAWGEDATVADTGAPYLDMGTTISPYPDYVLEKKAAEIVNHGREPGVIEAGDEVKYTITLTNRAVIELLNIKITDKIEPAGSADYVANSLTLSSFDDSGKLVWKIESSASGGTKTYYLADGVTIDTSKGTGGVESFTDFDGSTLALVAGYTVDNAIDRNPSRNGLQIGGFIQFTYKVTIKEDISKELADANFIVSNSVKLQADGVEKDKINKIDLSGTITDGVVTFISGQGGSEVSSFEPGNDIWIRVTDNDQNKNATTAQNLTVTLTNTTTGEKETVTLTETGVNTGVFEGKVSTTKGTGSASDNQTDGQFKLKRGDEILVEYTDPNSGNPGDDPNDGIDNPTNWGINSPNYQLGENNNIKIATVEDSGISVNDILVNEASPYGVFTVQGAKGQPVKLELTGAGTATSGTDYLTTLEYYDVTSGTWKPYTPGSYVTIENTDGTLLVRNPIVNDDVYEGAETYELKVTPKKLDGTDGSSTTGTATIFDDGTGTIWKDPVGPNPGDPTGEDPSAPKDHDRFPQVDNPVVNEGAGYVVFTVTTQKGDTITKLTLTDGTATSTGSNPGETDYTKENFEYWNGTQWVSYTNDTTTTIVVPNNGAGTYGELQVRVAITNDTLYEFSENFTLAVETITAGRAVGTATIKDDGTGTGGTDDDRIPAVTLQVDNPVVNEASGFVVFTVKNTDGSNPVDVALNLADGTAKASSTPPAYGESDKDYFPDTVQYWNGTTWVDYTPGSSDKIAIAASGELQVRVKIHNDTVYEGAETFNLVVTPDGVGSTAVTGTATILDDGTGTIWVPGTPGTPGTPKDPDNPNDPNQPNDPNDKLIPLDPADNVPNLPFNDDRTPFVTSPTVNEGSEYVVFEVTTVKGEVLSNLAFTNGSAKVGTVDGSTPKDGSVDYDSVLEYYDTTDSTWKTYTTGNEVKVPSGTLLVRTKIANDDNYEVSENFNLTVTVKSDGKTATGVATILDDGTGTIFNPDGTENPSTPKDDDRPVTVNSPTVNEGSPWIVFEVGGIAGTPITSLVLTDGTAKGGAATDGTPGNIDFDNTLPLQYFNGTQWVNFVEGTGTNIPAGGTLLVRVAIFNDTKYEQSETFTLTAKTQGNKEATGTGTIKDDGTGTIWIPGNPTTGDPKDPDNPANPGTVNDKLIPKVPTTPTPNLTFDDDRTISISNGGKVTGDPGSYTHAPGSVREDVQYTYFEISGVEQGVQVKLVAENGAFDGKATAALTLQPTMQFSTDNGLTWQTYSEGNKPVAPTDGKILVRVDISSENTDPIEPDETFRLVASYANNPAKSAAGIGTITDKLANAPKIKPDDMNENTTTYPDPKERQGEVTVYERGLTTNDGSKTATGTIQVEAGDGIDRITLGDDTFTLDELRAGPSITTPLGTLKVTGVTVTEGDDANPTKLTLNYSYTLNNPDDHSHGDGIATTDEITLAVGDKGEGSAEGSLKVTIIDDVPTAKPDTRGVVAGTTLKVNEAGGVLNHSATGDKSGADGWAEGGGVVGVVAGTGGTPTTGVGNSITGTYGTLKLNADGSFSYTATSGGPGDMDVFTYTVKDKDGDTKTTTLTITIKQAPADDVVRGDEDQPVIGNVIRNGRPGDVADVAPNDPEQVQLIKVSIDGVEKPIAPGNPAVYELTEGKLVIESDGSYRFDPTPDWNGKVPEITYTLAYGEGVTDSTSTATLNITIDPVQDAFDDSTWSLAGTPVRTETLGNDTFSNPDNSVSIVVPPSNGTLVVNPDRSITYTPTPDFTGYVTYTYRVTTPEGIWEDAVVTVKVDSLPPPAEVPPAENPVPPYVAPPVPPQEPPSPYLGVEGEPEMPPYEVGRDVFDEGEVPQRDYELLLDKKIPDQPVEPGKEVDFLIPQDTFRHTDPTAKLTLVAAQLDGSPLPDWLVFDSATGGFSGTPPAGFSGEILVRVVARDGANRQAETVVRLGDRVAGDPATPPFEQGRDPVVDGAGKQVEHELLLEKKIPDQPLEPGKEIDFLVPKDAFRHTDPTAKLTLSAAMVDGSPLPAWLTFDPATGGFKGTPPADFKGELLIKVVAKDDAGRQVETIVRISDQVEPDYEVSIDSGLMVNGEHVLQVAKGVPDFLMPFEADGAASIEYVIPMDAFVHSDPNAKVELAATLADGTELPKWLVFDAKTGKFKGIPPKGFTGELQIKIIARDQDGRQAETMLRIKIGEQKAELQNQQAMKGKPSLTSMLKSQGSWAWKSERDRLVMMGQEIDRIKSERLIKKAG